MKFRLTLLERRILLYLVHPQTQSGIVKEDMSFMGLLRFKDKRSINYFYWYNLHALMSKGLIGRRKIDKKTHEYFLTLRGLDLVVSFLDDLRNMLKDVYDVEEIFRIGEGIPISSPTPSIR